jgi:hypothetical protein
MSGASGSDQEFPVLRARRDSMDEYTSLAGASIVPPPLGKVSGLTAKRGIGERKKQKRNGKEKREKEEEGVIVHKRIQSPPQREDAAVRPVARERERDEEDTVMQYGKRPPGKQQKSKIDIMI